MSIVMPSKYCVYLTVYKGNKLPPYYIGSSSVSRVNEGYHGSVKSKKYSKTWQSEIKHSPHLFKTHIVKLFPTRRDALLAERKMQMALDVTTNPLYVNLSVAQPDGGFGFPDKYPTIWTPAKIAKMKETLQRFYQSDKGREICEKRRERMLGANNHQFGKRGELGACYGRSGIKHPLFGLTKEKNPNYGSKRTEEQRRNMSINHAPCAGAKNARALKWLLTSPDGDTIECHGNVEKVAADLKLSMGLLRKHLGSAIPALSPRCYHKGSKLSVGWKLEKLD